MNSVSNTQQSPDILEMMFNNSEVLFQNADLMNKFVTLSKQHPITLDLIIKSLINLNLMKQQEFNKVVNE